MDHPSRKQIDQLQMKDWLINVSGGIRTPAEMSQINQAASVTVVLHFCREFVEVIPDLV